MVEDPVGLDCKNEDQDKNEDQERTVAFDIVRQIATDVASAEKRTVVVGGRPGQGGLHDAGAVKKLMASTDLRCGLVHRPPGVRLRRHVLDPIDRR